MTPLCKRNEYSDDGRLPYTYRENTEEYGFVHVYLYEDGTYFPITNEDGSVIEGNVCICNAYSSSECVCGVWDDDYQTMGDDE